MPNYLTSKNGQAMIALICAHYIFPILVKYIPGLTLEDLISGVFLIGTLGWSYLGHKEDVNMMPPDADIHAMAASYSSMGPSTTDILQELSALRASFEKAIVPPRAVSGAVTEIPQAPNDPAFVINDPAKHPLNPTHVS